MFKNESIVKEKTKKPKSVKKEKTKDGGVYIVYLGSGLWKYGLVTDYSKLNSRVKDHERDSIIKINEFSEHISKDLPKRDRAILVYDKRTSTPKGCEENIGNVLENNKGEKIKLFNSDRSSNEHREYFVCDDFDYISDTICLLL